METFTCGATVLTPALVLPPSLTWPGASIVTAVIGDAYPDVVDQPSSALRGDLISLWETGAAAQAAAAAFTTSHGPWTLSGGEMDLTFTVTGDVRLDPAADGVRARTVTVTILEVAP